MSREQYQAYRKNKIETGLIYQDFVVDLAWQTIGLAIVQYSSQTYQRTVGESRTGVEIKHDEQFARSGNLYIELAEKALPRPGPYFPSGIYRDDNTWLYVIGDYNTVFIFAKTLLRQLHACLGVRSCFDVLQRDGNTIKVAGLENKTKTSVGFLINKDRAESHACVILQPNAENKISKLTLDLQKAGRDLHAIVAAKPGQGSLFQ